MYSSIFHGNEYVDRCNVQYQNLTDNWRKITGSQGGVVKCDRDGGGPDDHAAIFNELCLLWMGGMELLL